jgi:hypothetical protein
LFFFVVFFVSFPVVAKAFPRQPACSIDSDRLLMTSTAACYAITCCLAALYEKINLFPLNRNQSLFCHSHCVILCSSCTLRCALL